jgi:hypothetical protein
LIGFDLLERFSRGWRSRFEHALSKVSEVTLLDPTGLETTVVTVDTPPEVARMPGLEVRATSEKGVEE